MHRLTELLVCVLYAFLAYSQEWCLSQPQGCYIVYEELDEYINHLQTTGFCQSLQTNGPQFMVTEKSPLVSDIKTGSYNCFQNSKKNLMVKQKLENSFDLDFVPPFTNPTYAGVNHKLVIKLKGVNSKLIERWLNYTKSSAPSVYQVMLGDKIYAVQQFHDGNVQIKASVENEFFALSMEGNSMQIHKKFCGSFQVTGSSLTTSITRDVWISNCGCKYSEKIIYEKNPEHKFHSYCEYLDTIKLHLFLEGKTTCTVSNMQNLIDCILLGGGIFRLQCKTKMLPQDKHRNLHSIITIVKSSTTGCLLQTRHNLDGISFVDSQNRLLPEQATYNSASNQPIITKVESSGPGQLIVSWQTREGSSNHHVVTAWRGTVNISTCTLNVTANSGQCELKRLRHFTYYSISVKVCNISLEGSILGCSQPSELVSQRTTIEKTSIGERCRRVINRKENMNEFIIPLVIGSIFIGLFVWFFLWYLATYYLRRRHQSNNASSIPLVPSEVYTDETKANISAKSPKDNIPEIYPDDDKYLEEFLFYLENLAKDEGPHEDNSKTML